MYLLYRGQWRGHDRGTPNMNELDLCCKKLAGNSEVTNSQFFSINFIKFDFTVHIIVPFTMLYTRNLQPTWYYTIFVGPMPGELRATCINGKLQVAIPLYLGITNSPSINKSIYFQIIYSGDRTMVTCDTTWLCEPEHATWTEFGPIFNEVVELVNGKVIHAKFFQCPTKWFETWK